LLLLLVLDRAGRATFEFLGHAREVLQHTRRWRTVWAPRPRT
jgi:hypothetical protein